MACYTFLTIDKQSKSIPYIPQVRTESINHGFKVLKGNLEEAKKIAEVQDNKALQDALLKLNDSITSYFTIGCEKSFNQDEQGFWAKGFLELTINDINIVENINCFFHLFNAFVHSEEKDNMSENVQVCWEIKPAFFLKIGKAGYTITIFFETVSCPTLEICQSIFKEAIDKTVKFLLSLDIPIENSIY